MPTLRLKRHQNNLTKILKQPCSKCFNEQLRTCMKQRKTHSLSKEVESANKEIKGIKENQMETIELKNNRNRRSVDGLNRELKDRTGTAQSEQQGK